MWVCFKLVGWVVCRFMGGGPKEPLVLPWVCGCVSTWLRFHQLFDGGGVDAKQLLYCSVACFVARKA